jgi:hypothetical protein
MSPGVNQRSPAHQRKLRHTAAGVGLLVLGAALGLIGGGLWLHARRKAPSNVAAPFTLGADLQSDHAATLHDDSLSAPRRPPHD